MMCMKNENCVCGWCFKGIQTINGERVSHGICSFHHWIMMLQIEVMKDEKYVDTSYSSKERGKMVAVCAN
jgi:hypothetical protein